MAPTSGPKPSPKKGKSTAATATAATTLLKGQSTIGYSSWPGAQRLTWKRDEDGIPRPVELSANDDQIIISLARKGVVQTRLGRAFTTASGSGTKAVDTTQGTKANPIVIADEDLMVEEDDTKAEGEVSESSEKKKVIEGEPNAEGIAEVMVEDDVIIVD
ncbi:hypothetical protein CALVIDRAFT_563140 [Calocera viscosa TUFC12733]|uniref:Uncharacterized protein n=1 Tax=Calocera viscosa (strain TUFC12733) TaxID=1330018 RepID=A0A167N504_CALVF|nr:hypothetical protein CALVIDRAFT_563140 [Calocera viscosa TUFC12733]